jgi:hypothetical protein
MTAEVEKDRMVELIWEDSYSPATEFKKPEDSLRGNLLDGK